MHRKTYMIVPSIHQVIITIMHLSGHICQFHVIHVVHKAGQRRCPIAQLDNTHSSVREVWLKCISATLCWHLWHHPNSSCHQQSVQPRCTAAQLVLMDQHHASHYHAHIRHTSTDCCLSRPCILRCGVLRCTCCHSTQTTALQRTAPRHVLGPGGHSSPPPPAVTAVQHLYGTFTGSASPLQLHLFTHRTAIIAMRLSTWPQPTGVACT